PRERDHNGRTMSGTRQASTVAVTGSRGLVGSALAPALAAAGHRVLRLVRGAAAAPAAPAVGARVARWDPESGARDSSALAGMAVGRRGAALAAMLTPFRLGAGGPAGGGAQWVSWIAIDDLVAAILHALDTASLAGAVNAVAPEPVQNRELARTLGRVLGRP